MTKLEFNKRIDKALKLKSHMGHNTGICYTLGDPDTSARSAFREMCGNRSEGTFWYGSRQIEKNQDTRRTALEFFRQYCISEKLYRSF